MKVSLDFYGAQVINNGENAGAPSRYKGSTLCQYIMQELWIHTRSVDSVNAILKDAGDRSTTVTMNALHHQAPYTAGV